MEEQLKDLNKTLNKMLSTEDRFTEKQRQHIRDKIAKKRSGKFSTMLTNWKPIVSTAVTLVLLFAIAQVMFDNISFNGVNQTSESADSAKESAESSSVMEEEAESDMTSGDGPAVAEGQLNKAADKSQSPPFEGTPDAVVQEPALPLNDELLAAYEQLKSSQSQEALKDLGAFQVMQLYFYADQNYDYETQYMLLYQNPAGAMPSKKMYVEDAKSSPSYKEHTENRIEELKQVKRFEIRYFMDDPQYARATIAWGPQGEGHKNFHLIRDQQMDIWAVMMAPMQ